MYPKFNPQLIQPTINRNIKKTRSKAKPKVNDDDSDSDIENFYEKPEVQKHFVNHINPNYDPEKFPLKHPFTAVCVGVTGSMKSNCVMNILKKMNGTFEYIYLITQDKDEPLYQALEEQINDKTVLTIIEGIDEFNKLKFEDMQEGQTLMIFDDMCVEPEAKQKLIENLYIRGRKMLSLTGISCIYLSQSYFECPSLIRKQAGILILKKINGKNDTARILSECSSLEVEQIQLTRMYKYCCPSKSSKNFMLIDKNADEDKLFRKNFKQILNPDDFL
jgi:hypothetical protein